MKTENFPAPAHCSNIIPQYWYRKITTKLLHFATLFVEFATSLIFGVPEINMPLSSLRSTTTLINSKLVSKNCYEFATFATLFLEFATIWFLLPENQASCKILKM